MAKKEKREASFDRSKMLLSERSSFTVQEAYKTLRTNVMFSLPGNECKTIGIISPNRGEGKSSVAVNLAISFAQINKKVIIIDCDMRLPTIASKLGMVSSPGISNYLAGTIDEIPVYRMDNMAVDVVPSGNIPPDSTRLIESPQMVTLIEELKKVYDFIIFDFPPITIVPDAVILSSQIDGYLVIVRQGVSEHQKISEALKQMRFANANIIGFIYNGKTSEKKYYKKKDKYYSKYYYRKSSKDDNSKSKNESESKSESKNQSKDQS